MDLFGGLGLGGASKPSMTKQPASNQNTGVDLLGDLFGTGPAPTSQNSNITSTLKEYTCYSKNNLNITLTPQLRSTGTPYVDIIASFINVGTSPITNLVFQIAVPKSLKLLMQTASGYMVSGGGKETQVLRIENPGLVCYTC